LAAILSGLDHPTERAREALTVTEMDPDLARPIGTFSKGMRQRVKIAQALVHDPIVLMMDEPLNGLDPRQRRNMTALIHGLGEAGKTILISSHVLEEVERFGSHVVVIAHGRLAAQGDFRAIRALMEDQPMRIRIVSDDVRPLTAALLNAGSITGCNLQTVEQAEVTTTSAVTFRRHLPYYAKVLDQRVREVTPLDDDLESVFRYLVGGRE
jgi:ABC-2 type transport system ATP-binding protein